MQPDRDSICPKCEQADVLVISRPGTPEDCWDDEFTCESCEEVIPWDQWLDNPNIGFQITAYMSRNRSKTPHGRRVLGLPSGHPDQWASSEKDAMRLCEKHNINYETQEFLTGDDKARAIESARKVNGVKS